MASGKDQADICYETRFAAVMYGGVSLAIYINGITQELLRMVRATATTDDGAHARIPHQELRGTERIYRELGQMLGRDEEDRNGPCDPTTPLHTRFVVDILSGTSAGGINAIFLGKALANGQDINQLKDLWISEGDIEKLINDSESATDGLRSPSIPPSLLNGQRMYRKLWEAFEGMDRQGTAAPLVEEVDLFVTATDLEGLTVPLQLSDMVVQERRHRNVFHFRLAEDARENDFKQENNPFLAFAARCTSAFPVAFEPMKLSDIEPVMAAAAPRGNAAQPVYERWKKFFTDYEQVAKSRGADLRLFTERAFGEGGYLDNKPFSYAIDALPTRLARVPTTRKLIYIEPVPEQIRATMLPGARPNAVENLAAAASLARYETIREDLQRILQRNRLIERVERILSGMEEDVVHGNVDAPWTREDFAQCDLAEMINKSGVAYGGYHRLKIAALTDEIAELLACIVGFDPKSDEFLAIRYLVRVWRDENFVDYLPEPDAGASPDRPATVKQTQCAFLVQYDLAYRLRRLNFVMNKIDQIFCFDSRTDGIFKQRAVDVAFAHQHKAEFRKELIRLRQQLMTVYRSLLKARAALRTSGEGNPIAPALADLKFDSRSLRKLLDSPTEEQRLAKANELFHREEFLEPLHRLAEKLRAYIESCTVAASERCTAILDRPAAEARGPVAELVAAIVGKYYFFFDRYDLIAYPILYSTEVGDEIDKVDVVRISPQDAPSLIDESQSSRRKLAGTAFMSFGAFLDRGWRENDILWGRLDGAERIITTLLAHSPDAEQTAALIKRAHEEILTEHFQDLDHAKLCTFLSRVVTTAKPQDLNEQMLRELALPEIGTRQDPLLQSLLQRLVSPETMYRFFRERYQVCRDLNPKLTLRTLARGTHVIGKMLTDISEQYRIDKKPAVWLARIGGVLWGVAEVSVPGNFWNLISQHWIKLLYLFEFVMMALGFFDKNLFRTGCIALVATFATHLLILLLGDIFRGRYERLKVAAAAAAIGIVALAVVGLAYSPMLLSEIMNWFSGLLPTH
jgi:patatin-related protein